jgi:hypothetical protein
MWAAEERAGWDRARDQHVALAKAAKIKPLKKALITDVCRGQANVRWVERHGEIPRSERREACPAARIPARGYPADLSRSPRYWAAVTTVLKKKRSPIAGLRRPKLSPAA